MGLTIKEAVEKIKNESQNKTLFVNVERQEDYSALLGELRFYNAIRLSAFFNQATGLPNIVAVDKELSAAKVSTLVLGLASYYAFKNGDIKIIEQVKEYALKARPLIFLCYGLSRVLEAITDPRLTGSVVLVGSEGDGRVPTLTIARSTGAGVFDSLNSFLVSIEDTGNHSGLVLTSVDKQAFSGKWKVNDEPSGFRKVKDLVKFKVLEMGFGESQQWEWLLTQSKKSYTKQDIEAKISQWSALSPNEKWLCFLSAKNIANCYLNYAALRAETVDEFAAKIYECILDFDFSDKKVFESYYAERKKLIEAINDAGCLNRFCNLSKVRESKRIHYLTDLTLQEKEQIIECAIEYRPSYKELLNAVKLVYPLLYEYLSDYNFGQPLLDDLLGKYFNQSGYKYYKLLNGASKEFLDLVNARIKEYGKIDSVQLILREMSDIDSVVKYCIDALGIEFAALIKARAAFYGLTANITPAVTGLPSTTEQNWGNIKDGLTQFGFTREGKTEALDDVKHARHENARYEKVKSSIYLAKEIEIIDKYLAVKSAEIKSGVSKIVIVSDHGASRLALIHKGSGIESTDKTSLRYAKAGTVDVGKYEQVTAEINGYHCVANYDCFKGSSSGVEVHGGATLEEIIVPIIELTLDRGIKYSFRPVKSVLELKNKVLEKYRIVLSNSAQDVFVKVEGRIIKPTIINGVEIEFDLGLDTGEYIVTVFVDKTEIGKDKIKINSDLAQENDMF